MVRAFTIALFAALTLGCATGDGMQSKLRDASTAYNRSLRWGDVDRAAEHLPKESQMEFMAHHEDVADKLVIVDYELTRLDIDKTTGVAMSRAELQWHTDRRLVVETTVVEQVWQWFEGDWTLVDERRTGGTPLGIFAEPQEDPHPYLPGLEKYRQVHEIGEDNKNKGRSKRRRHRAGQPTTAHLPSRG